MFAAVFLATTHAAFAVGGSFTISTAKSYAPGEKPKIHLYSRNVDELEFRVYHVQDPEKFVNNLPQMHSFGSETSADDSVEELDEKTWLERFHDWKHRLWVNWRQVLRDQLSRETRQAMQEKQAGLAKRSRIVGVAQFAQIPLLNDKQLVARWRQQMPMTFVSDSQMLPIDPLTPGMYLVEATDAHLKAYTILMVSQTALITRNGNNGELLTFAEDRKTGAPVAGAKIALSLKNAPILRAVSSADGLAKFAAPKKAKPAGATATDADAQGEESTDTNRLWIMARNGGDVALVAPWYSFTNGEQTAKVEYYTYTDRPVYRPGHTVHWKSIVREYSGNTLLVPSFKQVHVTVKDSGDKAVFEKDLPLSAMGTVSGELELTAASALGSYSISVARDKDDSSSETSGSFIVEEYRKPEYQVRVSTAKARVLQGSPNQATIDSRYFFGEPVANAKVKYTIHQSAHYWYDEGEDDESGIVGGVDTSSDSAAEADTSGAEELDKTGKLDADGKLTVTLPTRFVEGDHSDKDYVIEAGVTDDAGREITGRYRFLATYGSYRIHVEPVSYIAQQGKSSAFLITAVDYDNKPVRTHVHLHLKHSTYAFRQSTDEDAGDADTNTGADGKATVEVPITVNGSISITASSDTPEHRTVQSSTWLWVSGSNTSEEDSSGSELKIVADKKSYAPGDVAHLTIAGNLPASVDSFHALITATGYTIEYTKVLASAGKSLTFDVPITKDSQPSLTVEAVFLKDEKLYQASKQLKVPPTQQQLQVELTPTATTFQPQQAATYDVMARDSKGQPVAAELSFGVVDEAIYSLYPDSSGDIVKHLYPDRYSYSNVDTSLDYYFSGSAGDKTPLLAERHARFRPQLAQVKPSADAKAPRIRKDFPDTAAWQPAVHTDAAGHARVTLTFPDSLTTWRATVRVITADSKAGSTVNRVIVRKNIIVRMGQPRFLRKGDVVSVPVIVHNYLTEAKSVQISLAATGVDIIGGGSQQVNVAAKQEATLYYKLSATAVGTATLTAKAITNQESDALQISLPVKPSGVRKSINAAGAIADSGERSIPVNFPANTDATVHTLSVEVSPSIAGTMFSALDYLTAFPYGCTEQTMSSFLPNIIVGGAVNKLHLQGRVNQSLLQAKVKAGVERLSDFQHDDGGWGWWKEDKSQVFMTSYVVSGLGEAARAGFDVTSTNRNHAIEFLQTTIHDHPRLLPELRAYVTYALSEVDSTDVNIDKKLLAAQLDTLYSRRSDLSPQALAFTGLAMLHGNDKRAAEIAHLLEGKAQQGGEFASWRAGRNELLEIDYDASAESTAFVLKFLVAADPTSSLLPKAAQWLVANRSQGFYWGATQQTAFVLFGLTDYLVASKELSGEADAEVFVNNVSAGRRHFTQADALSGATLQVAVDAARLQSNNSVRVVTRGTGRKYFTVTGNYFSTDKTSYQQGTMALNITRDYFRLQPTTDKNGNIVYTLEPLRGAVQQGDVLAVHIGVSGSNAKYLLIEDPIPAGVEFLQNEGGYNIVSRPSTWEWWYTRREFHDDRAAIFADEFTGRRESFYLLKVVNPGSFAISPASVEPMYQPGVQATTDELHLDVKEVQ